MRTGKRAAVATAQPVAGKAFAAKTILPRQRAGRSRVGPARPAPKGRTRPAHSGSQRTEITSRVHGRRPVEDRNGDGWRGTAALAQKKTEPRRPVHLSIRRRVGAPALAGSRSPLLIAHRKGGGGADRSGDDRAGRDILGGKSEIRRAAGRAGGQYDLARIARDGRIRSE